MEKKHINNTWSHTDQLTPTSEAQETQCVVVILHFIFSILLTLKTFRSNQIIVILVFMVLLTYNKFSSHINFKIFFFGGGGGGRGGINVLVFYFFESVIHYTAIKQLIPSLSPIMQLRMHCEIWHKWTSLCNFLFRKKICMIFTGYISSWLSNALYQHQVKHGLRYLLVNWKEIANVPNQAWHDPKQLTLVRTLYLLLLYM